LKVLQALPKIPTPLFGVTSIESYNKVRHGGEIMFRKVGSLLIGALVYSHFAFAQAPQQRIIQPIVVNGQQVQGVYIVQNGVIEKQMCSIPQQYVTADQSSSGWACFEASTGMWLLNAQPPQQTAVPQQGPAIIYTQPSPIYVAPPIYGYYPVGYPYYGYPYFFGPSFTFGFGFRSPIFVRRGFRGGVFVGRPFVGGRR
jgi:hypothetical protein